jgi:transposase
MKDGTTHLDYKAEQAVEMKTEMILSARGCQANAGETQKLETTFIMAQAWLEKSGSKRRSWRLRPTRGIIRPETLETFADF